MRSARALLLAISLQLHHALATSSTTTLTSTTTVATTTVTVTLRRPSGRITMTETLVGPTTSALLASVPSSTVPTSTAKPSTTMSQSNSIQSSVLNSTNYYRSHYEAQNVTWNSTLASYAQNYAKGCIWKHSGGPYGENLAANFETPTLAIDAWANEEKDYSYDDRKFSESTGHFTQLVWQNTTSVGCGLVQCNNAADNGVKGAYLVCEYSPRGNVQGQFGYNVGKSGAADDGEPGFGGAEGRGEGLRRSMAALVVAYFLLAVLC